MYASFEDFWHFSVRFYDRFRGFRTLRIMGTNVLVAIFFSKVDSVTCDVAPCVEALTIIKI